MPAADTVDRRVGQPVSDREALIGLARRCRRLMQGIRDDRTRQALADMAMELENRAFGAQGPNGPHFKDRS
jgi:hypothetical protein